MIEFAFPSGSMQAYNFVSNLYWLSAEFAFEFTIPTFNSPFNPSRHNIDGHGYHVRVIDTIISGEH